MVERQGTGQGGYFKGDSRWHHATSLRSMRHLPGIRWCSLHLGPSNLYLQYANNSSDTMRSQPHPGVTKAGGLSNVLWVQKGQRQRMGTVTHMSWKWGWTTCPVKALSGWWPTVANQSLGVTMPCFYYNGQAPLTSLWGVVLILFCTPTCWVPFIIWCTGKPN